jgi:tripartite-type tricarboxylate transporter receptor subunit TctC
MRSPFFRKSFMNRPHRFATLIIGALAAAAWASSSVAATDASWPTRAVRILVGFPAGSTPDMSARTLAEPLSRALGQPVIVENRPGASGNIAADLVAKATDDHTLGVVINGNLTSAKLLYPQLPYDPAKDFTPLSLLTTAPLVLVAPANCRAVPVFLKLPDGPAPAGITDRWATARWRIWASSCSKPRFQV